MAQLSQDRPRLTAAYILSGERIRCDQCSQEGFFDSGYHAEPNTDLCLACWALHLNGKTTPELQRIPLGDFIAFCPAASEATGQNLRMALNSQDRPRLTATYVLSGGGIRCDQCSQEGFDSGYHAEPNTDLCLACWTHYLNGKTTPELQRIPRGDFIAFCPAAMPADMPPPSPVLVRSKSMQRLRSRGLFGDRLRLFVCGGAAVPKDLLVWLRSVVPENCLVMESYGTTETGGITVESKIFPGVQVVICDVQVQIESCPELGYSIDDKPFPRGEILVKTPTTVAGYFGGIHADRFTADGFYRTGDVGEYDNGGLPMEKFTAGGFHRVKDATFDPNNVKIVRRLKLLDRKGDLFKLANGEFIAPSAIENALLSTSFIQMCCVTGTAALGPRAVVAIVVISLDAVAQLLGIGSGDVRVVETQLDQPAIRDRIHAELLRVCKERGIPHPPRGLIIATTPWTPEMGLLTTSLKISRNKVVAFYKHSLAQLHTALEWQGTCSLVVHAIDLGSGDVPPEATPVLIRQTSNTRPTLESLGLDSLATIRLRQLRRTKSMEAAAAAATDVSATTAALEDPVEKFAAPADEHTMFLHDLGQDILSLAPSVSDQAAWALAADTTPLETGVFVTGATGFLGAFVVAAVLHDLPPTTTVYCLVRAPTQAAAQERLEASLRARGVWRDDCAARVHAIAVRNSLFCLVSFIIFSCVPFSDSFGFFLAFFSASTWLAGCGGQSNICWILF